MVRTWGRGGDTQHPNRMCKQTLVSGLRLGTLLLLQSEKPLLVYIDWPLRRDVAESK